MQATGLGGGPAVGEPPRRPAPRVELWQWQMFGACREHDLEEFFHPALERGPARARRDAAAKAVCAGCPVLLQCRDYALTAQEAYGVWGGMSAQDREELRTGLR